VESLFDAPIVHRTDPPTSDLAASEHTRSGKRGRHARLVLQLVRDLPGRTAIELWHEAGAAAQAELKEPQEVRRRLTDLLHIGLVQQSGQRKCRIRGNTMMTWTGKSSQNPLDDQTASG
jgi:hypothetical protein